MSEVLVEEPPKTASRNRPWRGVVGSVAAFLGLGLAVLSPVILRAVEPPRKELSAVIAHAGAKLVDKVKGGKPGPALPVEPAVPWAMILSTTVTVLGLVGAGAGTASWIRREDRRLAGVAVIVGGLAMAWSYVVLALAVAVILFFLLVLLD